MKEQARSKFQIEDVTVVFPGVNPLKFRVRVVDGQIRRSIEREQLVILDAMGRDGNWAEIIVNPKMALFIEHTFVEFYEEGAKPAAPSLLVVGA